MSGADNTSGDRRVAMGLTYYSPYVSGLTNAARDVAEGLAERGWSVTVVASQHDAGLPPSEEINGVRVIRTPVVARMSKGVISPTLPFVCAREIARAGLGNLHLPMLEAGAVATLLRRRYPLVTTYQCDVTLGAGAANRCVERAMDFSTIMAARRSAAVSVTSFDYLESSRTREHLRPRALEVPAPALNRGLGSPTFRDGVGPHIGFLGRIVEEKGVPYLVEAFRGVAGEDWRLLIGGDFERVAGGSTIADVRRAAADDDRIRILGFVPDERMADFYASLDVFALPSVNPLEAFGIAQVEAMLAGIPVVASGLPGVRQPVLRTGFGRVVPPRDVAGLGKALLGVVTTDPSEWRPCRERAEREYGLPGILDRWEEVFSDARSPNAPRRTSPRFGDL